MQKIQILLDESKIKQEHIYNLLKMQNAIDSVLVERYGFRKAPNGFYLGSGDPSDFTGFMGSVMTLKNQPWFIENVETWLWFNSDDSEDPDDFAIEDIKLHYSNCCTV